MSWEELSSVTDYFNFNLQWEFNFWTFTLTLIYIIFLVGGYYLISNQVKLVKKETWTNLDRFKCFVYSIFFAGGCEIIIAMMVTFANQDSYAYTAPFILIPYCYNLIIMTLYPLADFLYMAHSKQELARSPPHKILERYIINKIPKPFSYLVALFLYLLFFIIPPILIIVIYNHEFIIVWTTWQMIFPLGIITYYGSKGFITGLVKDYNRIPRMNRSLFIGFENSDRAFQEFQRDPVSRIMLPLRFYLYFWTMYSFYITWIRINPDTDDVFNTLSYGFTVYLVLLFGVVGYFSRFWGRRTKFKTMDIMYAAFLIGSVGVNVMVNFVIANPQLLAVPYAEWEMSATITGATGYKFVPAALIEEIVLTLVVSYYLFFTCKKGFINDTIHSFIAQAEEFLDPIIPFNFTKNRDPKKRTHANRTLIRIYDRVPVKRDYFLTSPELKDPLFDALCDPDPYAKNIAKKIIINLITNHQGQMVEIIEEEINTSNFDKSRLISEILIENGDKIIHMLNPSLFYKMFDHPEFHLSRNAVKLLRKYYGSNVIKNVSFKNPSDEQISHFISKLEDMDYDTEVQILKFLSNYSNQVPNEIFSERLDHHNSKIRSIAANSVGSIDLNSLDKTAIPKLVEMLYSPNTEIQTAVMSTLAKIGDFKKNNIPSEKFYEGLFDQDRNVRDAALKGYKKYIKEEPKEFDLTRFLKLVNNEKDNEVNSTLIELVGNNWEVDPDKIFSSLMNFIKSEHQPIQKTTQKYVIRIVSGKPEKYLTQLLKEKDTESIIKKGKIAQTIIAIGNKKPSVVISLLMKMLQSEDEISKINSAESLSELANEHHEFIQIKPILETWLNDKSSKVKKNLSKVFSSIAKSKSQNLKKFMPMLLKGLTDPNTSVRLAISKMLVDIAKSIDKVIPFSAATQMMGDSDPFVRESGLNLLGLIGKEFPKKSISLILASLDDENDFVKTAAAAALTALGTKIEDETVLTQIKELINHSSKWTRLAALDVIIMVSKNKPNFLSEQEIMTYLEDDNIEFKSKAIQLIESLNIVKIDSLFPVILKLLEDPNNEIRKSMISTMVRISPKYDSEVFIPKLLRYLNDETSLILQQSIALIFRRIAKYEKKALKKRIISMLKIRVEVSQDQILSEVMSDLLDDKVVSIL